MEKRPHIVILGGGFGGLYAAKTLANKAVDVTLVDQRNFHLFQPLLYQVATGALSPANIAAPHRSIFRRAKNIRVVLAKATGLDPKRKVVRTSVGSMGYDYLIIATGCRTGYFGHQAWETRARGLKNIEDATLIRHQVLEAFERAETAKKSRDIKRLLTFVIVGGGPTGVELAGALAEIANETLKNEFRRIAPEKANIQLVEAGSHLLAGFDQGLSEKAARSLSALGVQVRLNCSIQGFKGSKVVLKTAKGSEHLEASTVLWAAGVEAPPIAHKMAKSLGTAVKHGRIPTDERCRPAGRKDVFVIGDLCGFPEKLPGTAPVAMQQGHYVARLLLGKKQGPFRYRHRGSMATIGRMRGVAELYGLRVSGALAWFLWLFVHLMYLVEFGNRILVLTQWTGNYFTRNRAARLITGFFRR